MNEERVEAVEAGQHGKRHDKKRIVWLVVILAILVVAGASTAAYFQFIHKHPTKTSSPFPIQIQQEIQGFKPYYLNSSFSTDYVLQSNTVSYDEGVLLFSLKNPSGNTLVFTEEATPPNYDISQLEADNQFQTGYGQAYITNAAIRTTGALFTSDHTWILINAPNPIGADLMQEILNALVPTT